MKDWILRIYKLDRRCKSGQKLHGEYTYKDRDSSFMTAEAVDLAKLYPASKFRLEIKPATKIVKNLMSGKEIEIAADTPRCCDPSSELYWSM